MRTGRARAAAGIAVVAVAGGATGRCGAALWIASLGPVAARRAARVLDRRGRSRRPPVAALCDRAKGAGACRRAPTASIPRYLALADRLRGQALSRACGRRSARASLRAGGADYRPWPHPVRRLDADHAGGAAAGAARRALARCQAAPDRSRRRDRAAAQQGRGAHALSEPRALWRQSRRHSRRRARLFRQGAEAAHARRGGPAGGAAAVAGGAPARPLGVERRGARATACSTGSPMRGIFDAAEIAQAKAEPVPAERKPMPTLAPHAADDAVAALPGRSLVRLTIDAAVAGEPRGARARARPGARARHFGRDPCRRSCDRRGAGPGRLRRLFRRRARRPGRHDARAALARLDAQALHLWARLRGRRSSIRRR